MNKLHRHCKPLASRAGQKLFPICYVDCRLQTAGRRLTPEEHRDYIDPEVKAVSADDLAHQSRTACTQWGDATQRVKDSWLKSWYFPLDAFRPWPRKTDICCWWDSCPFDWTPFPLPYQYDIGSNRYRSIGMFCGPSCAKAYAIFVKRYTNLDNVFAWIEAIATDLYGYRIDSDEGCPRRSSIPIAPNKELLQKYCGPEGMTIEEYRKSCSCGRRIALMEPGWITQKQVVQAEQGPGRRGSAVYHRENPDDIQRTQDIVKVHRIPFAGLGARRISDYLKPKS